MNLIIYYGDAGFFSAKQEIQNLLNQFGDGKAEQSLIIPGMIQVQTTLKPRTVIEELREKFLSDPDSVKATVKWLPADHTCGTNLQEVKEIIREDISYMITPEDRCMLDYNEHNASIPDCKETIKTMIKTTFVEDKPDKILRIDIFEEFTAITLMRPKDIFEK